MINHKNSENKEIYSYSCLAQCSSTFARLNLFSRSKQMKNICMLLWFTANAIEWATRTGNHQIKCAEPHKKKLHFRLWSSNLTKFLHVWHVLWWVESHIINIIIEFCIFLLTLHRCLIIVWLIHKNLINEVVVIVISWKVKIVADSHQISYQHGKLLALFWSNDRQLTCAHKLIIVMTHFGSSHVSCLMGEILNYSWSLHHARLNLQSKINSRSAHSHEEHADDEFSWTFSTFLHCIYVFLLSLKITSDAFNLPFPWPHSSLNIFPVDFFVVETSEFR